MKALVVAAGLMAAGGAYAASTAATVSAVSNSSLSAKIIVDAHGLTLYHFTTEKKGTVGCTGACRKIWPPLLVAGAAKPVAGPGLSAAKLGTIKRPDGGVQLTYGGLALYRYSGDKKAGQVNGQGVEGSWYAITPAGSVTKATASSAVSVSSGSSGSSTSTPSSTPTDTSGGSYNY